MIFDMFAEVHWLGAAVAALAWFAMGAAWYIAPPISRRWQAAGGIEIEEGQQPDPKVFALTLLAYFVATIVTSLLAAGVGVASIADGAALGLVVGVGYALTAAAVAAIYDQKPQPFTYFWINGVFNVVGLTVAGGILGAFT
ncbi:MAG: DUF1761 domain-containing protein [Actinomycetota bacterium]